MWNTIYPTMCCLLYCTYAYTDSPKTLQLHKKEKKGGCIWTPKPSKKRFEKWEKKEKKYVVCVGIGPNTLRLPFTQLTVKLKLLARGFQRWIQIQIQDINSSTLVMDCIENVYFKLISSIEACRQSDQSASRQSDHRTSTLSV